MQIMNIGQRSYQIGPKGKSHSVVLSPGNVLEVSEAVAGKLLKMFPGEVKLVDLEAEEKAKAKVEAAKKKADAEKAAEKKKAE